MPSMTIPSARRHGWSVVRPAARPRGWAPIVLAVLGVLGPELPHARSQPPKWTPVDPGFADTGPLSASRRIMPTDLRVPTGFDKVYRVPGRDGRSVFARRSGAVTAVFPRSQYTPTADGTVAEIPAGTVYYIGNLPESLFGSAPRRPTPAPNAVDRSVPSSAPDLRARPQRPGAPIAPPARTTAGEAAAVPKDPTPVRPNPRSFFENESLRQRRVGELIDRAAAAGTGPVPRRAG